MPGPVALATRLLAVPAVEQAFRPVGDLLFGSLPVRRVLPGPLRPAIRHRVSVIIPSYGYGRYVEAAIRSAATQEEVDVEVIVVDDCGPDDSLARARAQAARHPEGVVQVIANDTNMGHALSFQRGVDASRGTAVMRLDADDELMPGALARAVAVLEAAPSVGLVYGEPFVFSTPDPSPPQRSGERALVYSGSDWVQRSLEQARNLITTPEAVWRRSVMDEVGPWRLDLRHSQDLEFWLRVASASDVARIEGPYQAAKRNHPVNMSNTAGLVGGMYYECHAAGVQAWYEAMASCRADADRLRDTALRVLGDEAAAQVLAERATGEVDPDVERFARDHASPRALGRLDRTSRPSRLRPGLVALTQHLRWAHWRTTGL